MAQKYSENKLYNTMLETSYDVNKMLPKTKRANVNRFQGLANKVTQTTPQTGGTSPSTFKNLGRISTPYGGNTNFEKFHPGVDIANTYGTKIPAFTGGKVVEAKTGQGWDPKNPSFGNYVVVQDSQGNMHRYSHLSQEYVKVGDTINKGSVIGAMGSSGGSYSPSRPNDMKAASHLDYRIWKTYQDQKQYLNPTEYLSSYTYK